MKGVPRMAAQLLNGQKIQGKHNIYNIYQHAKKTPKGDIWFAVDHASNKFVIKTASKHYLSNEREMLKQYQGHQTFRQLVDESQNPPALVLQYLDADVLHASNEKPLKPSEIKYVAKDILKALVAMHNDGFTHTDIKPDNILVNYGNTGSRFSKVQLADCGDSIRAMDVGDFTKHVIGADFFRSPEALLMQQWDTPTDIWSFGATIISLLLGRDLFRPIIDRSDEAFTAYILQRQHMFFGPFPLENMAFVDDDALDLLLVVMQMTTQSGLFSREFSGIIAKDDIEFLQKIMKLNPQDRPSARELLQNTWFDAA